MIVRCLTSTGESLPVDLINRDVGLTSNTDFRLVVGKDYVVFALAEIRNHIWYCVLEEDVDCPYYKPASLFAIKDARVSRYWLYAQHDAKRIAGVEFELAFREWAQDPEFYTRLVDGDAAAERIFTQYRPRMELEFSDDSVSEVARELEDGYVVCAQCNDAFRANRLEAMAGCPNCGKIQHNPCYRDPADVS